jgi:hypothetical protein
MELFQPVKFSKLVVVVIHDELMRVIQCRLHGRIDDLMMRVINLKFTGAAAVNTGICHIFGLFGLAWGVAASVKLSRLPVNSSALHRPFGLAAAVWRGWSSEARRLEGCRRECASATVTFARRRQYRPASYSQAESKCVITN